MTFWDFEFFASPTTFSVIAGSSSQRLVATLGSSFSCLPLKLVSDTAWSCGSLWATQRFVRSLWQWPQKPKDAPQKVSMFTSQSKQGKLQLCKFCRKVYKDGRCFWITAWWASDRAGFDQITCVFGVGWLGGFIRMIFAHVLTGWNNFFLEKNDQGSRKLKDFLRVYCRLEVVLHRKSLFRADFDPIAVGCLCWWNFVMVFWWYFPLWCFSCGTKWWF